MKRQRAQLLILVVVLCALAAAFFGIRQYNKLQAQKPAEEEESIFVIDALKEDVTAFSYDYEGEIYSFEKEDETWYAAEDHSLNIKQTRMTSMLGGVMPLTATQIIENVTDLEQYGLVTRQKTITLETEGASYILYVGDKNELTSSYYVSLPSTDIVYVVSSSAINRFNYALEDLIEEEEESSTIESTEAEGSEAAESSSAENAEAEGSEAEESTAAEGVEDAGTEAASPESDSNLE